MAEVPERAPPSETVPIRSEGDQPKVLVVDKKTRPYYLSGVSWKGMVLDVKDDSFVARLKNIYEPSEQEEAEILNEFVTDQDDLELIKCNVAPSAGPYPAEISQGPSGPI
jgi:hypothetical protein